MPDLDSPAPRATVREAALWGGKTLAVLDLPSADLEEQLLLAHTLGLRRVGLVTRDRDVLTPGQSAEYGSLIRRRGSGEPHAFLTGEREFWSLPFSVDRAVLIPRPETEGIVEAALEYVSPGSSVVDMGTGCGNIVVSLAAEIEGVECYAADVSLSALKTASINVARHHLEGRVRLVCSDLFGAFNASRSSFDAIVANPPYIPTGEIAGLQREVRDFEPLSALDGGEDGLDVIRRLLVEAPAFLQSGGHLIMEIGAGQAPYVNKFIDGVKDIRILETRRDLGGLERIIVAARN